MPGYFQQANPWAQVAALAGGVQGDMGSMAMHLAQMRQQQAALMQEGMLQRARMGQQQDQFNQEQALKRDEFATMKPYREAETGRLKEETTKLHGENEQFDERKRMAADVKLLMGALKSPMLGAMVRDPQSGPAIVAALRHSGVVPEGSFDTSDDQMPALLKAALPALLSSEAMQTPGSAERMLNPVQLAPGRTPQDLLTGDRGTPVAPIPSFRGFGRGGILDAHTGEVIRDSEPYPTPNNTQLSPNAALGAFADPMKWEQVAQSNPAIASLVTNTLMKASQGMQPSAPAGTNAPAPVVQPPVAGKPLDPDTARAFLAKAGGNKDMARALAKQAGYNF